MRTQSEIDSTNFPNGETTSNQSNNFATSAAEKKLSDTTAGSIIEDTFFKKIGLKLDKICSRVMGIDL